MVWGGGEGASLSLSQLSQGESGLASGLRGFVKVAKENDVKDERANNRKTGLHMCSSNDMADNYSSWLT